MREPGTNTNKVATAEEPKSRVMKALAKTTLSASGIGFVAFPEAQFKKPQAAALASTKLRRELLAEGLIEFEAADTVYRLSRTGRQWVAQYLVP